MTVGERADRIALLATEGERLRQSAAHLEWSLSRAVPIVGLDRWTPEDLAALYREVVRTAPTLLAAVPRVLEWARTIR